MQNNKFNNQVIDARVDRVMAAIKRLLIGLFVILLVVATLVVVLEIKRQFQIDLFKGINFSIDDWYFDNVNPLGN